MACPPGLQGASSVKAAGAEIPTGTQAHPRLFHLTAAALSEFPLEVYFKLFHMEKLSFLFNSRFQEG